MLGTAKGCLEACVGVRVSVVCWRSKDVLCVGGEVGVGVGACLVVDGRVVEGSGWVRGWVTVCVRPTQGTWPNPTSKCEHWVGSANLPRHESE